jgi:hypothetical protein
MTMVDALAAISVLLAVVIVAVVAYHLIGIYVALKRGADHLEKLAGGLVAIRDNTAPLNGKIDTINGGLGELVAPLLAANGNLAAIVKVAVSRT